jgi:hypothetical protein
VQVVQVLLFMMVLLGLSSAAFQQRLQ